MTQTELPAFDQLWDYSDPGATEVAFREILGRAATAGAPAYRLELLTQIARTEGLQKRFDDAHKTLDRVETNLHEAGPRQKIRYLLERGRALNSSGKGTVAETYFLDAWNLGQTSHGIDGFTVDAAHMMAIVTKGEQALDWNRRAMELAEKSSDPTAKKWLGALYNNIGWTYHDMGEFEPALDHFEKGLAWRQVRGAVGPTRIAKWSVGRALRSLGRFELALALQQELEQELSAAGETDVFVFEEIAECHMALGAPDAARPYFANAAPLLEAIDWVETDRKVRARTLGSAP